MTWVKLDDALSIHHKVIGLSDGAFRTYIESMCLASRSLSDGLIKSEHVRPLGGSRRFRELAAAGLMDELDGGAFSIHDYLVYNPSRESVLKKQAEARDRMGRVRGNNTRSSDDVRANNARSSLPPDPRIPEEEQQEQIPPTPQPFEVVERDPVWRRLCEAHKELTTRLHPPPTEEQQFETWVNAGASEADIESALAQIKAWPVAPEKPWAAFREALGSRLASRAIGGTSERGATAPGGASSSGPVRGGRAGAGPGGYGGGRRPDSRGGIQAAALPRRAGEVLPEFANDGSAG